MKEKSDNKKENLGGVKNAFNKCLNSFKEFCTVEKNRKIILVILILIILIPLSIFGYNKIKDYYTISPTFQKEIEDFQNEASARFLSVYSDYRVSGNKEEYVKNINEIISSFNNSQYFGKMPVIKGLPEGDKEEKAYVSSKQGRKILEIKIKEEQPVKVINLVEKKKN